MIKFYSLFHLLVLFSIALNAQTPTVQDCLGAIPLTQAFYYQDSSFTGEGNIPNEINTSGCPVSCLLSGEKNDVWYILSVPTAGNLCFNIIPNSSSDDYDWAVFNLTNASCADIYSDSSLMVSCNYSAKQGTTGANGQDSILCASASDGKYNALIPVSAGETYVLNISNFSATQAGYTLDFSCTDTAIISSLSHSVKPPEKKILLFPNPAEDLVSVTFDIAVNDDCFLRVFDLTGKSVLYRKIEKESFENNTVTFSVADLHAGSYQLVLFVENAIAGRAPLVVIR